MYIESLPPLYFKYHCVVAVRYNSNNSASEILLLKSKQGPFAYFHTVTSPWGCHLGNHTVDKMLWGQKMGSLKSEKRKEGQSAVNCTQFFPNTITAEIHCYYFSTERDSSVNRDSLQKLSLLSTNTANTPCGADHYHFQVHPRSMVRSGQTGK